MGQERLKSGGAKEVGDAIGRFVRSRREFRSDTDDSTTSKGKCVALFEVTHIRMTTTYAVSLASEVPESTTPAQH